jgi:hypothetical protein
MLNSISNQVAFKGISKEELESRLTFENIKGVQSHQNQTGKTAPIASRRVYSDEGMPERKRSNNGIYLGIIAIAAAVTGIGYAAHKGKIPDNCGGKQLTEWSNNCIKKSQELYAMGKEKVSNFLNKKTDKKAG